MIDFFTVLNTLCNLLVRTSDALRYEIHRKQWATSWYFIKLGVVFYRTGRDIFKSGLTTSVETIQVIMNLLNRYGLSLSSLCFDYKFCQNINYNRLAQINWNSVIIINFSYCNWTIFIYHFLHFLLEAFSAVDV